MNKIKGFLKNEWIGILLILFSYGIGLYFAPALPERVPTHWNIRGEIDGYSSKLWGIVGLPTIMLGIYTLMLIIPLIDPKKKNYELFKDTYKAIRLIMLLFFLIIHIIIILVSLGYEIRVDKLIIILVGILFIFLGNYFGKVRQNWFVGIRTPWTLSDPDIWNKTHRLAGKLWVISGVGVIITAFINPSIAFVFFIVAAIAPIIYSYYLFSHKNTNS